MNKTEFYAAVADDILDYMPDSYEGSVVNVLETMKNNDTCLHGLTIREKGTNIMPIMYLEPYYQEYVYGKPLEEICMDIALKYDQAVQMRSDIKEPDLAYDKIKDCLRIRVVDVRSNKDFLNKMENKPIGHGYALTVYIDNPPGIPVNGMINITKDMANELGYDEKMLFTDAVNASVKNAEPILQDIGEMLFGGDGQNFLKEGMPDETTQILVLTNQTKYLGASVLFYPEMQKRIGEIVGGDYYILPSSVHEFLIIPDRGNFKANELADMVQSVNNQMVSPEEQLGNKVLFYRADMDKLIVAVDLDKDMEKGRDR